MNRKLKIIGTILLIILIVLLGAWFVSRKKATKNNTVPPTFRAFLGIGTSTKPAQNQTTGNEYSSEFTNEENTGTAPTSQNTGNNTPIRSSVFTNAGLTPINGAPFTPTPIGVGGGIQGGSGGVGTPPQGGGTGLPGGIATLPPSDQPECSESDVSIEFTADEIDRLNILKSRFFALATGLNTDDDLATEISNYDLFKSKSDKIAELYNYCKGSPVYAQAKATVPAPQQWGTVVAGPNGATINYRVPTPFWHDLAKDNQAFVHQGNNWKGIFSDPDLVFPERSIEHALRLNLW
ncbi:MAG: hypothetical protein AAB681_01550 [Patescibacteria group bacterium]